MKTDFDPRLGNPGKWSVAKQRAVFEYFDEFGEWPTHEVRVCLGCGEKSPCKSDCPAGDGLALTH